MVTKSNKKQNKFAKELFTQKYKSQKLMPKRAKVVLAEKKILNTSPNFLYYFRRHFRCF